jgi:hypothetical protein
MSNETLSETGDYSLLIVRKVSVLQGRAREAAEKLYLLPDDLVLVKTTITKGAPPEYSVEKIVGNPIKFLLSRC